MPKQSKTQSLPDKFQAGFLSSIDGRTELAKALRSNYNAILEDVGGNNQVGHVKRALIERFVWLEATLQTIEQDMAKGAIERGEAISRWVQAINTLVGLAKVLGYEKQANQWSTLYADPTSHGEGSNESSATTK